MTAVDKKKYLVDPAEAGVEKVEDFGKPGMPTEKGWRVVTPRGWHFRNHQICDKVQLVGGYADADFWIDWSKSYYMLLAWEKDNHIPAANLAAEGYCKAVANQPIVIRPREVVVGMSAADEHGIQTCVIEVPWSTNLDLLDEGRCYYWDAEKKAKVHIPVEGELCERFKKFQQSRNHEFVLEATMPEMLYRMYYKNALRWWEPSGCIGARFNADFKEWIYKIGHKGIREEIKKTIARLETESMDPNLPAKEYPELAGRILTMKACLRTIEAHIAWCRRYADKARELLAAETDTEEKKRLEKIADSCDWVAENPPRGLHDAIQLFEFWFEAGAHLEQPVHSISRRPDQVYWPYYKKEVLEDKTMTHAEAGELIGFMFFKMHEHGIPVGPHGGRYFGLGSRDFITDTVAGTIPETGADAWNGCTDLILDVIDGYRLHYPDVKIRWNKRSKRENIRRGCEVARTGMGAPSFKNDEVAVQSVLNSYGDETTMIEARDYAIVGCVTPGITRNSRDCNERTSAFLNTGKFLECAIFDGGDPVKGFEWVDVSPYLTGIAVKPCEDCATFEEFYQKFLAVYKWFATTESKFRVMARNVRKDAAKRTLLNCSNKRCIQEGVDLYDLDVPRLMFQDPISFVDTADSLVGIKKVIYDDKKYTWKQVKAALKADFVGYDEMRADFKKAPKFGNDDDYADDVMVRYCSDLSDIGHHFVSDFRGKPVVPCPVIVTTMFAMAPMIGALPNGRKQGEALADGSLCPHAEFDKSGAFSRLRSSVKIEQYKYRAWIYNQKLDFSSVTGDAGLDKFTDFVEMAMRQGQEQMQFNFVGREVLEDAMVNPEKYPLLSVRVSGYSAYFTQLPELVQHAIIDRVEQTI